MRIPIIIAIAATLISSCKKGNGYALEDQLFECYLSECRAKGIDAAGELDKVEKLLIQHNILEGRTGKDYINLIQRAKEDQSWLSTKIGDLSAPASKLGVLPPSLQCEEGIQPDADAMAISQMEGLTKVFEAIEQQGDLNLSVVLGAVLENFDHKDFENKYYRALFLTSTMGFIAMAYNERTINARYRHDETPDAASLPSEYILKVNLNANDDIIVNEVKVPFEQLFKVCQNFLHERSGNADYKAVVSLSHGIGTNYKHYLAVYNELKRAYEDIWMQESIKTFGVPFNELAPEQAEAIKQHIPFLLVEGDAAGSF